MESGKLSDNFSSLTENIKDYIDLQIDYLKLALTEKISKLASYLLIAVIVFILVMFLLLFLSLAFVFWFGQEAGPFWLGALIIAAVYVLGGLFVYFRREKLFINPLVTHLTKILMEGNDEKE
jgi:hypothetical protein